ncbi:MAG: mechanosensitive ion channel [Gammaproteobacteria bacterium]|nr:mechanosensitive ion channel [Gammaproteobacteria bacterium]
MKQFLSEVEWQQFVIDWGLKLIVAIAIFVIGRWIARAITNTLKKFLNGRDFDETLVSFLGNLVYAVLLTAVIIAALDSLGVPVTSLVAVLGAAGLAIGLALKDSLGNFASGVMLVMFRPFSKGDFVEAGGVSGKVEEVRIFNTILITPDNKKIVIPNGMIGNDTITNFTAMDKRRVDMVFGVGYDDDLKTTRKVLEKICADHPLVLDDPETKIFVKNLGDSSVDFAVRPWCKTDDYWTVWGDLLETGKVELEAAGLSIPYPQTDVHLHQAGQEQAG